MAKALKKKPASKTKTLSKAKGKSPAKPKAKIVAKKAAAKKAAPKKASKSAKPMAKPSKKMATKAAPKLSGAKKALAAVTTVAAGIAAVAASVAMKKRAKTTTLESVFTPLDDRIIVEKMEAATRTAGGLYIPDTVANEERSSQGRVIAVGKGRRNKKGMLRPLDVQLGDTVMFNNGGGSDVRIDEQDLVCLREEEIIAIMKP